MQFRRDLLASLNADPRRPVDLADELTTVAKTFAEAVPLRLDTSRLGPRLPGLPALVMAEAVRECLNNASYHAYGSAVTVTASAHAGVVTVSVRDDGPGCNPARVMAAWAHKQNAVHQVEAAGGAYEVRSGPRGTLVSLRYPVSGEG
jgi:signal transduction histidine kinase